MMPPGCECSLASGIFQSDAKHPLHCGNHAGRTHTGTDKLRSPDGSLLQLTMVEWSLVDGTLQHAGSASRQMQISQSTSGMLHSEPVAEFVIDAEG